MPHAVHFAHPKVLDEIDSWPAHMQADVAHIVDVLAEVGPRPRVPHAFAIGAGLLEVLVGARDGDSAGHLVYGLAEGTIVIVDALRAPTRTSLDSSRVTVPLRRLQKARRVAKGQTSGHPDREYAPVPYDRASFLAKAAAHPGFAEAYAALTERYLIARTLVAARVRAGLTQAEVARRMGTSASAVSRLEAGEAGHSPRLETLAKYAAALGCDIQLELVERPAPRP